MFCVLVDSVVVPKYIVPGMEHWGAIAYSDDRFLVDYNSPSALHARVMEVDRVIAHELVHQVRTALDIIIIIIRPSLYFSLFSSFSITLIVSFQTRNLHPMSFCSLFSLIQTVISSRTDALQKHFTHMNCRAGHKTNRSTQPSVLHLLAYLHDLY